MRVQNGRNRRKLKPLGRFLVVFLAFMVTLTTVNALILPAITLNEETAEGEPGIEVTENEPEATPESEPEEQVTSEPEQETVPEKTEEPEGKEEIKYTAGELVYTEKDDYEITLKYTEEAKLTDKAELQIEEIWERGEYEDYLKKLEEDVYPEEEWEIIDARVFDVYTNETEEIKGKTEVTFEYLEETVLEDEEKLKILVLNDKDEYVELDEKDNKIEIETKETESEEGTIVESISFEKKDLDHFVIAKVKEKKAEEATEETQETEEANPEETNEEETEPEVKEEEKKVLEKKENTYTVTLTYGEDANIPDGSTLYVREIVENTKSYDKYLERANKEVETITYARFFDIRIMDPEGNVVEPQGKVDVIITSNNYKTPEEAEVTAVHFKDNKNTEVIETEDNNTAEVKFEAESFSVYGIIYTVDFHWEVDGKTFSYSIPGGGYITLRQLVEVLGIANTEKNSENTPDGEEISEDIPAEGNSITEEAAEDLSEDDESVTEEVGENTDSEPAAEESEKAQEEIKLSLADIEISDKTKAFVADVESVEFSSPELVWVGNVANNSTVGELKENNALECQYSGNLTEEDIAEINSSTIEAGDWALVSLLPFDSEEILTVTMKDGVKFTIHVTDALHVNPDELVGKEVVIFDKTEMRALTSDWEQNQYRSQFGSIEYAEGMETPDKAHWTVEKNNNRYYLRSHDGKYLKIDSTNVSLVNTWYEATALTIEMGGNPDYRIYAQNDDSKILTYSENNQYDGFFAAPGGTGGTGTTRVWLGIDYAVSTPDRAGDWLLYFDDDFSGSEITIHVGETITLRPYNKWEWKEGNQDVQTAHWNVGTWSDWNISSSDANGSKLSTSTDGPFTFTRYVKYDNQLITHYWSVQGLATQTGDYTLTNTKNGKTITVHVVDGEPVNQPATINKIANIKVNLFDYDKNYLLDPADDSNLANNGNNKSDSVNKMGGSDHFYFLSSGSGNNNNESWNSYTHDDPNPNIVKNQLDSEGYPVLNHGSNTSLKYLFDASQTSWHGGDNNDGMIAYPDVVGMFQKDSKGYYYFNSNTNYFYYDTATGTSKLYEHTYTQTSSEEKGSLVNDKPIGFFPFHEYDSTDNLYVNQNSNLNHHIGMSMELEFMLPRDKTDDNGDDIIFDFSGDDDLWVFVEWTDNNGDKQSKLLLDLGGVHQPIHGDINFTNGSNTSFMETNRPYTLKVFYLERGGCDSNCSIRFNLPIVQDLTVAKKLTGLTEEEKAKYTNEEFTYEIVVNGQPYNYPNPNNKYEKAVLRNAAGEDITPANFKITNGHVKIKDGETLTITYLDRSDTFSVAEVKTPIMDTFEVPNAERYYHQEHDASLYEEEIHLTESNTLAEPHTEDWVTPTYELEDTEKVTFTNTLKEKNLEVEKKWLGDKNHPDSITFTVSASVDGGRTPYAVSELKESDGTTDKVFTLNDDNDWRHEIEHLPVNTPDGKFIFYDISEGQVEGYTLTGLKDITAEDYNYCNVDVVKLWPDSNGEHTEVLRVVLKNSEGKYYAGVDNDGEANFSADPELATVCELKPGNNYTHRFARVPAGEYTAVQLNEDEYSKGLATYIRNIIQYELENSPIEGPVDPEDKPNTPEIHKRIDALRDGVTNPDSAHTGEDLTDLYRLYLDYKVKSLKEANGVDLLLVIDHSGSMNNYAWQGNPYRAPAVEDALNGEDGVISEFLEMNDKNQWAAVGFKGPDGAADYYWSLGNPWEPATADSMNNAGLNGSEVLSSGGDSYVFTRNDASPSGKNITLDNEGANILTNYTAGLWRAEQFLLKQDVKEDGRKKVIVFISDGIPTLHIDSPNGTLQDAGTANGSWYYRDAYGGCPNETLTEFGYFVDDMTTNGYAFGENMEFYTIGFGETMQTASGSRLLNGMLDIVYGVDNHDGHFMTISDTGDDYSSAANKLKDDLRTIMGMNEKFTNIVIQDDLSGYVDLYGLAEAGSNASDIMQAAKAKVTMTVPDPDHPEEPQIITLYENGAPAASNEAKFTKTDGTTATIIQELQYDASTKTVKAVFDPEYHAAEEVTYTLSFDVKTTDTAYTTYAATGYDKYAEGDKQGQVITGDTDTDFLGTDPANATSVEKEGFRSNDEAKATYTHNDEDEELEYPHPVIQVAVRIDIVKIDQTGAALQGAKFNLYGDTFDPDKPIEENAGCLIEENLQSEIPTDPAGTDAVIRSGKLSAGTYYLVETETPDGFNSLPGPVKITITETNGIFTVAAEIAGEQIPPSQLVNSDGVWKLSVMNTSGIELPYTGGSGTSIFYTLGSILVLIASAWFFQNKISYRRGGRL